jgi:outer membrane protein W
MGALLVITPLSAQTGYGGWGRTQAFRAQLGIFEPEGDSRYWNEKADDFSGGVGDMDDVSAGISYVRYLSDRIGLQFGTSFYEGETEQAYLDFVDNDGFDIFHSTQLEQQTLTIGVLFHLLDRDATLVPYVGVGGGLYSWEIIEAGEFINFDGTPATVFSGSFVDDGEVFGYYVQAGVDIPLGTSTALFVEGRWNQADDDLSGDFAGFGELDLSGTDVSVGFSWTF